MPIRPERYLSPVVNGPTVAAAARELSVHLVGKGHTAHFRLQYFYRGTQIFVETLTQAQVNRATNYLIDAAADFATACASWNELTSQGLKEADIGRLVEAGKVAGEVLFPNGQGESFVRHLVADGIELVYVNINEEPAFAFPWALVRVPGMEAWLGELACFSYPRPRPFIGLENLWETQKPEILLVGYAEDNALLSSRPSKGRPEANAAEISIIENFSQSRIEPLSDLPPGPLESEGHTVLNNWLNEGRHLWHFNCHAINDDDDNPSDILDELSAYTRVQVRMGSEVSGFNIVSAGLITGGVILDVCEGAYGRKFHNNTCLSACFLELGAVAVCATTSKITDEFGTQFSKRLYESLSVTDFNLFKAMRKSQESLLKELQHPMALYFTFEGYVNFQVGFH